MANLLQYQNQEKGQLKNITVSKNIALTIKSFTSMWKGDSPSCFMLFLIDIENIENIENISFHMSVGVEWIAELSKG